MHTARYLLLPALLLAFALGCDSSDPDVDTPDPGPQPIAPTNADALSEALQVAGATRLDGAAPSATTDAGTPVIGNGADAVTAGPGGAVTLQFGATGDFAGVYFLVQGASGYFQIPGTAASFQFALPDNLNTGTFSVIYCVYTDGGLVSLPITTTITVDADAGDASGGTNDPPAIAPGDADALSNALQIMGATRVEGAAPSPTTDAATPVIGNGASAVTAGPGGVVTLRFGATSDFAGIYFLVQGASGYFQIPGTGGSFQFTLPDNLIPGTFTVIYCVYTDGGLVSLPITTTITVDAEAGDTSGGTNDPPTTGGPTTEEGQIPWTQNAVQYRGRGVGARLRFDCPEGGAFSTVWGTDLYTDDSSVCTAAVHAGVITQDAGGSVVIELRPGADSYDGSTRNGVTTRDWGNWGNSFVVID
ncbi:MAG: LCCL domain-containing protein [Bacteroidota bacterium]